MTRTLLVLATGVGLRAGGMTAGHHKDDGESVKVLSATDIKEMLDGKEAKATVVEVTIEPRQSGVPQRHRPVIRYDASKRPSGGAIPQERAPCTV